MALHFSQDTDYWLHKTKVFLHDPPDKAIHIPGHEERANAILAALGMSGSTMDPGEYKEADRIAAGMDRATLPGYVAGDVKRNGAVDFSAHPAITHPTGAEEPLGIRLPDGARDGGAFVKQLNRTICTLIEEDMGTRAGSGQGLSEHPDYRGREDRFAPVRFHYLFFLLRRRLAKENIGGLGGLWHRLPADTRIPDHSIWQHNGLVSALASSARLSDERRASLMVYALTPVQDFVARARKLRDFWAGSIILSWLAFEGICAVILRYGADHILYPSLHDQPLVDDLLRRMHMPAAWIGGGTGAGTGAGIASFPNKFVFLAPAGREEEVATAIRAAIQQAWLQLGDATRNRIAEIVGREDPCVERIFRRQLESYWEHHWGAVPLVKGADRHTVEELLPNRAVTQAFSFWERSQRLYLSDGEGQLYSVSHRLAQAMLAAGKAHRRNERAPEPGIKCDMFQEFEIVHYQHQPGEDRNPPPSADPFWSDLRARWPAPSDFGPNERLCALGLVKRLAYRVCQELDDHPLAKLFRKADSFPSTTEMALADWWQHLRQRARDQDDAAAKTIAGHLETFGYGDAPDKAARRLAQLFHELDEEPAATGIPDSGEERKAARAIFHRLHPVRDVHKYYAVLMMDGDRMGRLVNGDTLGATWESVLHPQLAQRLHGDFDPKFKTFWEEFLGERRLISPAVHAAISEALGDFALHTVPYIIRRHGGRLIYAGGDDVCAVLPASSVLDAALEIARRYGAGFVGIEPGGQGVPLAGDCPPEAYEKLGLHLGRGADISISAGMVIAHHKKPLSWVLRRAHDLLDTAKELGRNGFVLEVAKRSGGGRRFAARWDQPDLITAFLRTADALRQREKEVMSSSLAYRLDTFQDGLTALIQRCPAKLPRLVSNQLERSDTGVRESTEERQELARHIATLLASRPPADTTATEALIVANFIGHCRQERRDGCR